MINPVSLFNHIKSLGINFFAGVPDSLLKSFCAVITEKCDENNHFITANEGAAVGLGIGYYLGTQNVPLIYLQNSGLGNTINPLLSLASKEVYGIPMLIMIGWRGEPGTKDEPQHVHQGRVMIDSLESMELPYIILSEDEKSAFNQIEKAQQTSKEKNTPVILIIRKNTFEKFTYKNPVSDYELGREEAIIAVTKATKDKSAIVCTTGMPSRELFEFRALNNYRHHRDFLTVGGMGHASQIALGIAISQPNRKIYCFDGDGALLMHMGSIAIIGQSEARNFVHIVFNNGVHDSVGGQPTVGFDINFCDIAKACGYKTISSISKEKDINQTMLKTNSDDGPHFIEIKIKPGNRSNIGRPTTSPEDNKRAFVEHLQK